MRYVALAVALGGLMSAPVPVIPAGGYVSAASAPVRTGKERLSDKASDEQRVNDCKVPPEKRTRPRPTDCR